MRRQRSTAGRNHCGRGGSPDAPRTPSHGIARTLSKLGHCSRTEAAKLVAEGRVTLDGRPVRDPEARVPPGARLEVDGAPVAATARRYVALNKPRGVTTTTRDERGRDTVYRCFDGADLPWLAPVGRLDRASEGLLLFTNDPAWAATITLPDGGIEKTYHVQIDRVPDETLAATMMRGVVDAGEPLAATRVSVLRAGQRHGWLEVVLDEGRNRQIRRLLAALDVAVLRLVRVSIGSVALGDLAKGAWRDLTVAERDALPVSTPSRPTLAPAQARARKTPRA